MSLAITGLVNGALYDGTPAPTAATKPDWPQKAALAPAEEGSTVLLFAHPACPCTGASLHNLRESLSRSNSPYKLYIVFSRPAAFPANEASRKLRQAAQAIPNVHIVEDKGALVAAQFGASASGECFLFDRNGKQLFHGGVTRARGHYGESSGQASLQSILTSGNSDSHKAPTFGCALSD